MKLGANTWEICIGALSHDRMWTDSSELCKKFELIITAKTSSTVAWDTETHTLEAFLDETEPTFFKGTVELPGDSTSGFLEIIDTWSQKLFGITEYGLLPVNGSKLEYERYFKIVLHLIVSGKRSFLPNWGKIFVKCLLGLSLNSYDFSLNKSNFNDLSDVYLDDIEQYGTLMNYPGIDFVISAHLGFDFGFWRTLGWILTVDDFLTLYAHD